MDAGTIDMKIIPYNDRDGTWYWLIGTVIVEDATSATTEWLSALELVFLISETVFLETCWDHLVPALRRWLIPMMKFWIVTLC